MIRAYLVGGPSDLTIVALQSAVPVYRVAVMEHLHYNAILRGMVEPVDASQRIAEYIPMGRCHYAVNANTYIYEFRGYDT